MNNTRKEVALKNISTNNIENVINYQSKEDLYASQNYSSVIINNEIMEECFDENIKNIPYTQNIRNSENINGNDMMTDEPIPALSIPANQFSTNEPTSNTFITAEVISNPYPQLCEEYIQDIYEHLKDIEFDHLPSPNYMRQQNDINEKMRGILIDWLVEVHLKFKLLPETLFLTINLIDRYLEIKQIMRNRLQLVGVTAMLIACKYEEIYAPEVRDFVYITDKAYTKEEILQMENDMLAALDFNITIPSPLKYLEIYSYYLKLDEVSFMFCKYLLELFLVEYKMLKFNPSLIASSTVYITMKIMKKPDCERICQQSLYNEEKLRECAKDICVILDNVEKSSLQAVRKKFSLPKFMEVAKIKFN
jgi:G2/mitotic-specific cyclin-B, other